MHPDTYLASGIVSINDSECLICGIEDQEADQSLIRAVFALEDQVITTLVEQTIHVGVLELHSEIHGLVVNDFEVDATDGFLIFVYGLDIDVEQLIETGLVLWVEEACINRHGEFHLAL